jgi:hypothetical protein
MKRRQERNNRTNKTTTTTPQQQHRRDMLVFVDADLVALACLKRSLSSSSLSSNISMSDSLGLGFSNSLTLLSVLLCSSICNLVLTLSRLSLLGGIDRQGKVNLGAERGTEWWETGRRRVKRRNSKRGGIFKRGKTIDFNFKQTDKKKN